MSKENLEIAKLIMDTVPRTMRLIRTEMRAHAHSELTIPQFRVLNRLSRNPSTNREIADWMGVTPVTITKMIDKLEKRGLVTRTQGSDDRRSVALSCTRKGLTMVGQIRKQVQKNLATRVGALPPDAVRDLESGLHAMREIFPGAFAK